MKTDSYKIIVVIPEGKERKGLKYNSPDLLNFQRFIDTKYPDWLWFNVFNKEGRQIASFTQKSRCYSKRVSESQ
jgi:hypothetical protein